MVENSIILMRTHSNMFKNCWFIGIAHLLFFVYLIYTYNIVVKVMQLALLVLPTLETVWMYRFYSLRDNNSAGCGMSALPGLEALVNLYSYN